MKKWLVVVLALLLVCLCTAAQAGSVNNSRETATVVSLTDDGYTEDFVIQAEDSELYWAFTPVESGVYSFTTNVVDSPDNTSSDNYGALYFPEGYNEGNDDDGGNGNFLVTSSLKGGETYYLGVRMYNPGNVCHYTLSVTKMKTPDPITLPEVNAILLENADYAIDVAVLLPAGISDYYSIEEISVLSGGAWTAEQGYVLHNNYLRNDGRYFLSFGLWPDQGTDGVSTVKIDISGHNGFTQTIYAPVRLRAYADVMASAQTVQLSGTAIYIERGSSTDSIPLDPALQLLRVCQQTQISNNGIAGLSVDPARIETDGTNVYLIETFWPGSTGSMEYSYLCYSEDNQYYKLNVTTNVVTAEQLGQLPSVTTTQVDVIPNNRYMNFHGYFRMPGSTPWKVISREILPDSAWSWDMLFSETVWTVDSERERQCIQGSFGDVTGTGLGTMEYLVMNWDGTFFKLYVPVNVVNEMPELPTVYADPVEVYEASGMMQHFDIPTGRTDIFSISSANWYDESQPGMVQRVYVDSLDMHFSEQNPSEVALAGGCMVSRTGSFTLEYICQTSEYRSVRVIQPVNVVPLDANAFTDIQVPDQYSVAQYNRLELRFDIQQTGYSIMETTVQSGGGWHFGYTPYVNTYMDEEKMTFELSGSIEGQGTSVVEITMSRNDGDLSKPEFIRLLVPVHIVTAAEFPAREVILESMVGLPSDQYVSVSLNIPDEIQIQKVLGAYAAGEWGATNEYAYGSRNSVHVSFTPSALGEGTVYVVVQTMNNEYIRLVQPMTLALPETVGYPSGFLAEEVHTTVGEEVFFEAPATIGKTEYDIEWYISAISRENEFDRAVLIPEQYGADSWHSFMWGEADPRAVRSLIFARPGVYEVWYRVTVGQGIVYEVPFNVYVADAQGNTPVGPIIADEFGDYFTAEGGVSDELLSAQYLVGCPYATEEENYLMNLYIRNMGAMRRLTGSSPKWNLEQLSGEDIGLFVYWQEACNLEEDGTVYESSRAYVGYNKLPTQDSTINFRISCTWNGETVSRDYTLRVSGRVVSFTDDFFTTLNVRANAYERITMPTLVDADGSAIERIWWNINCYGGRGWNSGDYYQFYAEYPGSYPGSMYTMLDGVRISIPITVNVTDENGQIPQSTSLLNFEAPENLYMLMTDVHVPMLYCNFDDYSNADVADMKVSITGSNGLADYQYNVMPYGNDGGEQYGAIEITPIVHQVGDENIVITVTSGSGESQTRTIEAHYRQAGPTAIRFNGASFTGVSGQPIFVDLRPYMVGDMTNIRLDGAPTSANGMMEFNCIVPGLYNVEALWTLSGTHVTRLDAFAIYANIDGQRYKGYISSDLVSFTWNNSQELSGDYTVNGTVFNWHFIDGTLTINGQGALTGNDDTLPWKEIQSRVNTLVIGEGVTRINEYVLGGLSPVTCKLPSTLVDLDNGSGLPDTSRLISYEVSSACQSYKALDGVLYSASLDTLVSYPAGRAVCSYVVPESVKRLGDHSLTWANFNALTLQNGLESIGSFAFELVEIQDALVLPVTLKTIGDNAFANECVIHGGLVLNDGLQGIGEYAFSISAVFGADHICAIPATVHTIGKAAFRYANVACFEMKGDSAYFKTADGVLYSADGKTLIAYPDLGTASSFTVPAGVTKIGISAFTGTDALNQLVLPEGLVEISDYAFEAQYSITELTIPSTVRVIGESAFASTNLRSIRIPKGVTALAPFTFEGCYALTEVTLPATLIQIGASAFAENQSLTTVYYGGTQDQWQALLDGTAQTGNDALFAAEVMTVESLYSAMADKTQYLTFEMISGTYKKELVGDGEQGYVFLVDDDGSTVAWSEALSNGHFGSLYCDRAGEYQLQYGTWGSDGEVITYGEPQLLTITAPYGQMAAPTVTMLSNAVPSEKPAVQVTVDTAANELIMNYEQDDPVYKAGEGAICFGRKNGETLVLSSYPVLPGDYTVSVQVAAQGYTYSEKTSVSFTISEGNALILPEDLIEIAEEGFVNCGLEVVYLPAGLSSIGSRAFANNAALYCVYLPEAPVSIADDAFSGCSDILTFVVSSAENAEWAYTHGYNVYEMPY